MKDGTMQTRMKRLEGVRLEVDSRRRTVVDLRHSIEGKKAKPQTPKLEFQTEQLIKKMQHKENKLASKHFSGSPVSPTAISSKLGFSHLMPHQQKHLIIVMSDDVPRMKQTLLTCSLCAVVLSAKTSKLGCMYIRKGGCMPCRLQPPMLLCRQGNTVTHCARVPRCEAVICRAGGTCQPAAGTAHPGCCVAQKLPGGRDAPVPGSLPAVSHCPGASTRSCAGGTALPPPPC